MNPDSARTHLTVLSLGGGIQSTAMALAAANGLITQMPDVAIFADTQSDPPSVFKTIADLRNLVPFPIHIVTAGNLERDVLNGVTVSGAEFITIPAFTASGIGRRQCTSQYKIRPIEQEIRRLFGVGRRKWFPKTASVEQWIGISTDEEGRCSENQKPYTRNRWPLIEIGWNREDCESWLQENFPDLHVGRSSCVFCPYKGQAEWSEMKYADSDSFERACVVDDSLRNRKPVQYLSSRIISRSDIILRERCKLDVLDCHDSACEQHFRYQFSFDFQSAHQCDGGCFL